MRQSARILAGLFRPVDADTLAIFRIAFGFLMATQAFGKYMWRAQEYYSPDAFHFRYPHFEWVHPLPGLPPEIEVALTGVAALGIMFGFYFRASAVIFTVAYTHLFLIERSLFNNHYYLIILLGILLIATDSHAAFSYDASRSRVRNPGWCPFWHVALFRAQLVIVYFFGGIAKLGADWLQGEPMRQWLLERSASHVGGAFLAHPWAAWFFSYSGLVFDLSIGFLLLYRPTRYWALIPLLTFHLMNAYLWKIGVFPWLAIASTVVFFDPGMPRRWLRRIDTDIPLAAVPHAQVTSLRHRRAVLTMLLAYLVIQCLLPFRHHFYTHNVNWTETGHMFSWH
ncbi:MAG: HTTM domain-containing protein, partial [Candidatus Hydrogenedentes bacterium]|nr:HTTM domain-containing protein [Candidatus Hydrogenedentota bacterium]